MILSHLRKIWDCNFTVPRGWVFHVWLHDNGEELQKFRIQDEAFSKKNGRGSRVPVGILILILYGYFTHYTSEASASQ